MAGVANTFEAVVNFTDVGSVERLYHVHAEISDQSGNIGKAGESTVTDVNADGNQPPVDIGEAVLFEFDDQINDGQAPGFTLAPNLGGAKTDKTGSSSPSVLIDFDKEEKEYPLSAATASDTIKGIATPSDVEIDSHHAVMLTVVKLDNVDVSADASVVDSNSFFLTTSGLIVGTHTLEVNGHVP